MADVLRFPVERSEPFLRRRRLLIAAAVGLFFVAYAPAFFNNWRDREWITLFAESGQRLVAGETLYRHEDGEMYAYLPGLSVLTLPLAMLPGPHSVTLWYVTAFGTIVFSVWGAWRLTAGTGVDVRARWGVMLAVTLLLGGRFLLSPLENHQFDGVIAALVIGGLLAWSRGWSLPGAVLLGLGAACKGTPLLFAPYLVWRGQWRMALVMLAAFTALTLAPDVIGPRVSGNSHLQDCYESIVRPAQHRPPGVWVVGAPMQHLNQSLGATVHRFATFGFATSRDDSPLASNPDRAGWVRAITWTLTAGLIALTLWSTGRMGPRWSSEPTTERELHGSSRRMGLESGMVLCLMLLLSPQSSKAHFVVLILPIMQIVREAAVSGSRVAWGAVACLTVLGPLCVKGLIGSKLGDLTLLWGAPAFFTLVTLATLWHISRTLESDDAVESSLFAAPRHRRAA